MSLLGIRLNLLLGPVVPIPVPLPVIEALEKVEITHKDEGRSGFQLTFRIGRDNKIGAFDYPVIATQLVRPRMRAIVTVIFGAIPRVLSDGIITNQQVVPSNEPGGSRLVVTGEDVTLAMDNTSTPVEHPAQDETIIALKLIATYARYGMIPLVLPPFLIDPPIPIDRIPVQPACTDLHYLKQIASRFGYVFYVTPGPIPATNIAYWGPPIRIGIPQRALTVNMGSATNVSNINFSYEADKVARLSGKVQDRFTNAQLPVETFFSTRIPLSSQPPFPFDFLSMRTVAPQPESGLNVMQALARAQGTTDASTDNAVKADGELDSLRYNDILQPRALVGVRGAGYHYDGFYYVKQVSHTIEEGSYRQKFQLTREGLGSITPVVTP